MSLFTSSQFASAARSGADWRECAKGVLEELESVRASKDVFNFGFLYITDALADDAESILNLFKSVLNIENWIGSITLGVCANGEEFIDQPAISAMIGRFEEDSVLIFETPKDGLRDGLQEWLAAHDPMLVFTHGDPLSEDDPTKLLQDLNEDSEGFVIGGLSSSRKEHYQIAKTAQSGGYSGAIFSDSIQVATTLSQGCKPIGGRHTITMGDDYRILELDHQKAVNVFEENLKEFAKARINRDPDEIIIDEDSLDDPTKVPEEFQSLLKGAIHIALPVSESDQRDFMVRDMTGLEADDGSISVAQYITSGEEMMFVHRDDESVRDDLVKSMIALRKRVEREQGQFAPKGAVYVSCVARGFSAFSDDEQEQLSEMAIIRDVLGDMPLTGFYAGGEISNARLYGYTGILTLFL